MEHLWNLLRKNYCIFYDFETTGLNQFHDDIIEYAFASSNQEISSLIKTKKEIIQKIEKITGISQEMVKTAPPLSTEINKILDFINQQYGNKFLIAHNNDGFDKLFLNRILRTYGHSKYIYQWKHIDTLLFAKKLLPQLPSYNLKSLLIYFKIKSKNLHRATEDTKFLKLVYYELCKILSKKINISMEKVISDPYIVYKYIYN